MKAHRILCLGATLGALAVVLGAFGAHWLEGAVETWGLTPEEQLKRLDNWEVAVRYHMYHALALLAVGFASWRQPRRLLSWSAGLFVLGTAVFSGSLYVLVISGIKMLGAVVAIGGMCLIAGWITFAVAAGTFGNSD